MKNAVVAAIFIASLCSAGTASAQHYDRSYHEPRIQQQRPPGSRRSYEDAGSVIGQVGGTAGAYYGSGGRCGVACQAGAGAVGGQVGSRVGGGIYDGFSQDRYYSPRAYGTQTTTPYMVRRGR